MRLAMSYLVLWSSRLGFLGRLHAVKDPKTKTLYSRRLQGSGGNSGKGFEEINPGTPCSRDLVDCPEAG